MKQRMSTICGALVVIALTAAIGIATFVAQRANASQLSTSDIENVYTEEYQQQAQAVIDKKKTSRTWDEDHMLTVMNPYGTNTTSMYLYFSTDELAKVSYRVSTPNTDYPEFSATPNDGDSYSNEHEFLVLGLIPGKRNVITITLTYENGQQVTRTISKKGPSKLGSEEIQLERTVSASDSNTTAMDNGLYAVLGNDSDDQDFMYYYDQYGVLRGEIPILYYRSHRLLFDDQGRMLFSVSTHDIVAMNTLGRIEQFYRMPGNTILHHDYVLDDDGNLLLLATDLDDVSVQDKVVSINTTTGEGEVVLDLGDLFGSYKASTTKPGNAKATSSDSSAKNWDWFHANTIQYLPDGSIILSSRETSTIVKINDIAGSPSIGYMLGEQSFWENTAYAKYLYSKVGSFSGTGGQHSVTYDRDPDLPDGQYYLYMFNNNFGYSASNPGYDWTQIDGIETSIKEGKTSYFTKYLVDENAGTYRLVQRFAVPFSAYVSSAQEYEGTGANNATSIVVDSGIQGVWGEYATNGTLRTQYKMTLSDQYIYRVYKYDFRGFYFA